MVYRAIGLMSGSSLDGLDIVFAEFQSQGGQWTYEILEADCYPYPEKWANQLKEATKLSALDYQLLHTAYGHYLGEQVNRFIDTYQLQYKVAVIASHGHTTFHLPAKKMTAQLGEGAAIAAATQLPVVSDLRVLDVAFGGQGAPIVPIGEKLLMGGYDYFLNIGGIANISHNATKYIAFDVCPANRVLNMLANELGKEYDDGGQMAANGTINEALLEQLNALDYYKKEAPKSLANDFGTDVIYPMIINSGLAHEDCLRTYLEHIVFQISLSVGKLQTLTGPQSTSPVSGKLLVTGGGALNSFLIQCLSKELEKIGIETVVPDKRLIEFKEALIMAFIGVLRWRQEYTVLSSVTGASRDSIGGALWTGQEA
jgi:anhydro-N-acetylmuramic acid kinase